MIEILRPPFLCMLMITAAALAAMLKPTTLLAEQMQSIDLENMVPKRFDGWQMLFNDVVQIVDPGQRQLINTIYAQTLTRAYVNQAGYLIMLSIAYGKNQSDALQLHRPEVCYPAQGFTLLSKENGQLGSEAKIPVTRMQTTQGSRHEAVTYWTMIGDRPYAGSLQKKLIEIQYGMKGVIPDGMLVRVSSIDGNTNSAQKLQADFAQELIASLPANVRSRFAGH